MDSDLTHMGLLLFTSNLSPPVICGYFKRLTPRSWVFWLSLLLGEAGERWWHHGNSVCLLCYDSTKYVKEMLLLVVPEQCMNYSICLAKSHGRQQAISISVPWKNGQGSHKNLLRQTQTIRERGPWPTSFTPPVKTCTHIFMFFLPQTEDNWLPSFLLCALILP